MNGKFEFRVSSLSERKEFYEEEFNVTKVKKWFKSNGMRTPQLCAVDAGTDSGIIENEKLKGELLYFKFDYLKKKIEKYIPEDVYYCRNYYKNPDNILNTMNINKWNKQELVFDVDSDNIKCKCHKAMICDKCISVALKWALRIKKELKKSFRKIGIVYSGRGFHIHVLDKEAFSLSIKERDELNKKFSAYPIDPWVSRGYIDLIRMPYSLNGLVSRRVIPIRKSFDKIKAYPKFLIN